MAKDDMELMSAKRAYKKAKEEGNRQEEARWANVIGDILKNRGEYVEALRWLRIDYDISTKYLPQKHLLPTCQSIGELHLRLQDFSNALLFQKKHLELAKDAKDVIEQQRASTQLGRTYYDMFLRSEDDHNSIRNAMKYFKTAMKLAQDLRENPPTSKSSFIKEYIDAHNNIGMVENDIDKPGEAIQILNKGLKICDEEEIDENDDSRTRLHHNLGNVYMDLRMWDKAREHIEKDIIICKNIGHCQGEAKGYINLGELHYRAKKYDEAIRCYQKAFELADSMEDETNMIAQIDQNIEIVREAMKVMVDLKNEEQKLKKLTRILVTARGTPHERKCLLKQNTLLDSLIEICNTISEWQKHRQFAKRKKRIASELCDKEKLSDSFLLIGESYQKLRKFSKAKKWYTKSWEVSKSVGNLEGQALAKINMGNVLDSDGDWMGALNAFQEAYRIAVEANLPSIQLTALENMHYCQMIRFDNVEEARRLKLEIENLKQSKVTELEQKHVSNNFCPETDTEEDDCLSDSRNTAFPTKENSEENSTGTKCGDQWNDDMPLISLLQSCKYSVKKKTSNEEHYSCSAKPTGALPKHFSEETKTLVGRKRVRVVLSDDEAEMHDEVDGSKDQFQGVSLMDVVSSDESNRKKNRVSSACKSQDVSSKYGTNSCNPANIEQSTCSFKSTNHNSVNPAGKATKYSNGDEAVETFVMDASGSKCENDVSEGVAPLQNATNIKFHNLGGEKKGYITFKIDNDLIHVEASLYEAIDTSNMDSLKVELACLYYLQLSTEKISKGLLPILQDMRCAGRVLDSLEAFETLKVDLGNVIIEVSIEGWVQKRLMKLYIESCKELSEMPNMKLLQKLYISEVEDEVIASECELQDISITPLLNALLTNKTVAMLDLSHNLLGNGTMEKLQQFFTSAQRYGDLTLDLHCNRFGPTALFQICECPVLFTRLVMLNVSGNRLTDACGSYLSTILTSCKALYSLNIERCSITSRTIQKVAVALNENSNLSQLSIGYNNPISGNAIVNLMDKLAVLESFAELNLNGLKLNKSAVDSICQLAKMKCLSRLMLGSTAVGNDAVLQLTESLLSSSQDSVKLDISYCGLTARYLQIFNSNVMMSGIFELNLGGNTFLQEGSNALASLLVNPQCCVRVLIVNKCQLGIAGVLRIIQAVADNLCLQELHIADNISLENKEMIPCEPTEREGADILPPNPVISECSSKITTAKEAFTNEQGPCALITDCNLEVADSEEIKEATPLDLDDSCTSSCQKNSPFNCEFVQEISTAIGMAKQLEFLDLSDNGFTTQIVDAFYATWSSRSRAELSWRHVKDQTIHFSLETNKCCRVKPCCKKD